MMMLLPFPAAQQDSVRAYNRIKIIQQKPVSEVVDTISVCRRNIIEDVTFYDSANLITRIVPSQPAGFPWLFLEKNRVIADTRKTLLVKQLRQGSEIPPAPLHSDWIILIILLSTFLFTFIRKSSDNLLHGVERFFLFRGVNDPLSRDTGGIFNWESTIKNLVSFLILGLFGYSAASFNNINSPATTGVVLWIITVCIIVAAVTMRHFICLATGIASGERDVFNEYLMSVYQFYRFSALFIFAIYVVLSYTTLFPVKSCFTAGIIAIAFLYLIRVIRLFIIFLNRNISLFYLILYLCALEILPVVIAVKYISGLV
jgi:hypothetical protein